MRVKEINNSRNVCPPERVLEILQCIEMEPFSMSWSDLRHSGMLVPGHEGTFAPGHGGIFIADNVVHVPRAWRDSAPGHGGVLTPGNSGMFASGHKVPLSQGMVGCLPYRPLTPFYTS